MMSFWPLARQAAHRIEMTARVLTHLADAEAPGDCRHIVIMPKVPILSNTPTSSTDVPGRATRRLCPGSQVWTGTIRADREGDHEGRRRPFGLTDQVRQQCGQRVHAEERDRVGLRRGAGRPR